MKHHDLRLVRFDTQKCHYFPVLFFAERVYHGGIAFCWGSTGGFDVDGMLPLPLLGVGNWFALTRHGRLDVVASFGSFLIVFHVLRLVCVILVDVMTSSHLLFFSSVILSISLFPDYMVPRHKGYLNNCSCMLHIYFLLVSLTGNVFCSTSSCYAYSRC